jgi:hypothetical protein
VSNSTGSAVAVCTHIAGRLPCALAPKLTPDLATNLVHVDYDLSSVKPSPDNQFGVIIAAGWQEIKPSQTYHKLSVTFNSVDINNCHACFSWPFWVNAGGSWLGSGNIDTYVDNTCVAGQSYEKYAYCIPFTHNGIGNVPLSQSGELIMPEKEYYYSTWDGRYEELTPQIFVDPAFITGGILRIQATGYSANYMDSWFLYPTGIDGYDRSDPYTPLLWTRLSITIYKLVQASVTTHFYTKCSLILMMPRDGFRHFKAKKLVI